MIIRFCELTWLTFEEKIEPNPAEPTYILTELGVGYRMLEDSSL